MMEKLYTEITDYLQESGEELVRVQGKIKEIGLDDAAKNDYLTEEDLKIERGITEIVQRDHPDFKIYAEEEHDVFEQSDNLIVIDPISSTKSFVQGRDHYASVVAHVAHGETQFAAVYDPAVRELFTAQLGQGAFLNGQPIHVSDTAKRALLNLWPKREEAPDTLAMRQAVEAEYEATHNRVSFAVNYAWVAAGRYDGVISVAKDTFPEYAGDLLIREAGGTFTNLEGGPLQHTDRFFVAGNPAIYPSLFSIATTKLNGQ